MTEKRKAPTFGSEIKFDRAVSKKQIVLLLDNSTSMEDDGKIQALNNAVLASAAALCDLQAANKNIQLLVRRCVFNTDVKWADKDSVPVTDFKLKALKAKGDTNTGDAIRLCANFLEELDSSNSRNAGVIIVSDGQPNDPDDYFSALQEGLQLPKFEKADRLAIAIGDDADRDSLKQFVSPGFPVFEAKNAGEIVEQLKLASVIVASGQIPNGGITGGAETDIIQPNPAICESIEWS